MASKLSAVYREIKIYKNILKCITLSTECPVTASFLPSCEWFLLGLCALSRLTFSLFLLWHIDFPFPKLHRNLEFFFSGEILFKVCCREPVCMCNWSAVGLLVRGSEAGENPAYNYLPVFFNTMKVKRSTSCHISKLRNLEA